MQEQELSKCCGAEVEFDTTSDQYEVYRLCSKCKKDCEVVIPEPKDEWGEKLEELVNLYRFTPKADSVMMFDFVRSQKAISYEQGVAFEYEQNAKDGIKLVVEKVEKLKKEARLSLISEIKDRVVEMKVTGFLVAEIGSEFMTPRHYRAKGYNQCCSNIEALLDNMK